MFNFSRNSRSIISNWWWTVDKVLLSLVTILLLIGVFLNFSASPAVANRIGADTFHFVKRQLFFIPLAYGLMVLLSMQNLKTIRRISIIGYISITFLMVLTLFVGENIKGATRWISIFGFSMQPSEFIKPFFAVVAAWLFDGQKRHQDFPGDTLSTGLYAFTIRDSSAMGWTEPISLLTYMMDTRIVSSSRAARRSSPRTTPCPSTGR